ncbi:MAG: type IV pilus assembly protein PilM [Planctomycetes bacterium]|nr:type IV pilus assembly protein PilM [Planctomycetota bacterium]
MAAPKSVWGIDIGQCALKALKLVEHDGQLQAEAFEIIEHTKVLSQPDADREALIHESLEQFFARHDVSESDLAIAVPGQTSFTRFVKMPPVDPKKIPELVRFEAEQQIPFDISEVIWRWQAFDDPDSPDVEVGLFAMKRADVYGVIDPFTSLQVGVNVVQMAPLALYNFMTYDQQVAPEGATLLVDIGANGTNLVVSEGPRLWTRTIQLGGNNFTEALVKSFNLSFAKAEKLKRTAATSKYARQVFQAMRPVFADLVQEIQRSIGYYTSLHRTARFSRIVGVGNGFRLPGLQKFLQQNLSTPVVRIDAFNALEASEAISAPQFTENVLGFAVAYGLAVQGLKLTRIDTNLLPNEIASSRRWKAKRPWFAVAAAMLVAATIGVTWRARADYQILRPDAPLSESMREVNRIINQYKQLVNEFRQVANEVSTEEQQIEEMLKLNKHASLWPAVTEVVHQAIGRALPHQPLITPDRADALGKVPPEKHAYIVVSWMESDYVNVPETGAKAALLSEAAVKGRASGGGAPTAAGMTTRGIRIILSGRCPKSKTSDTLPLLQAVLGEAEPLFKTMLPDYVEYVDASIVWFPTTPGEMAPAGTGGKTTRVADRSGTTYGPGAGGTGMYGPGGGTGMYGPGAGTGMYGPGAGTGMYGPGAGMYGPGGGTGTGEAATKVTTNGATGQSPDDDTLFQIGWVLRFKDPSAMAMPAY